MSHIEALFRMPATRRKAFWAIIAIWLGVTALVVVKVYQQQERSNESARIERDLMSALVDTESGVMAVDASGAIRHWDAGAERLLGYTSQDVIGKSLEAVMPKELAEMHRGRIAQALSKTSRGDYHVVSVSCSVRSKSGQDVPVAVRVYLDREHGMAVAVLNALLDVKSVGFGH